MQDIDSIQQFKLKMEERNKINSNFSVIYEKMTEDGTLAKIYSTITEIFHTERDFVYKRKINRIGQNRV